MTDFDKLKCSYSEVINFGLMSKINYIELKNGNDILHKICESCVDNSCHDDISKKQMKQELELLKQVFSQRIEQFYQANLL